MFHPITTLCYMATKVNKFSELSKLLDDKNAVVNDLFSMNNLFRMPQIVQGIRMVKEKGVPCSILIFCLFLFRLCGETVAMGCRSKLAMIAGKQFGKMTYYRFLNNENINWRGFLHSLVRSFLRIVEEHADADTGDIEKPKCIIFDDTMIKKTGENNTMENISRVYDHVSGRYELGYKLLLMAYFDGISTLPADFSICSEKGKKGNYGLKKSILEARCKKDREEGCHGDIRSKESDEQKNILAIKMLGRAFKKGLRPEYVLYDSWFNSYDFIKAIRTTGDGSIHALGMAKNDRRKYSVNGKTYTIKTMIEAHVSNIVKCDKYKLLYMKVDAMLEDIPVRLFLIKYGKSKDWKVIITTDTKLKFAKAFSYYQIRWNIEVVFKECKQYLALGKCLSTDFDQQIADSTLVFAVYVMMSLRKRFGEYETMGEVYRALSRELFAETLWQRMIPVMVKILSTIFSIIEFDIEDAMKKLAEQDDFMKDMLRMANALICQKPDNQEANMALTIV